MKRSCFYCRKSQHKYFRSIELLSLQETIGLLLLISYDIEDQNEDSLQSLQEYAIVVCVIALVNTIISKSLT